MHAFCGFRLQTFSEKKLRKRFEYGFALGKCMRLVVLGLLQPFPPKKVTNKLQRKILLGHVHVSKYSSRSPKKISYKCRCPLDKCMHWVVFEIFPLHQKKLQICYKSVIVQAWWPEHVQGKFWNNSVFEFMPSLEWWQGQKQIDCITKHFTLLQTRGADFWGPYIYIYVYIRIICMYIYIYVYLCIYVCICVCIWLGQEYIVKYIYI